MTAVPDPAKVCLGHDGRSGSRPWLSSVRSKTVVAALVVVGVALGATSILLVAVLSASQLAGVDRALQLETASVAALATTGVPMNPIRTSGDETTFVQVVDSAGSVLASSASLEGQSKVASFAAGTSSPEFRTLSGLPIGPEGQFRVAGRGVDTPTGRVTVYAGESLAVVNRSVHGLIAALLIFDPIFLAVVGLTVWILVRRALSPVEAIRSEVAGISAKELDRRINEPPVMDEIGRLAITMNDMLGRLDASSHRQQTFVADASHELRSPLAAAHAELEVGLTHPASTNWPDAARNALGELERARRIVDDLVVLARFDEGVISASDVEVDLDELVLDQCTRIRRTTTVAVDVSEVSGARVIGNEEQLGRAVRNLLDNAVRHAQSLVTVELRHDVHQVVLSVTDDGLGIAPQDRQRIFERFARVDSARARSSGGSGLGLAIVHEIVTAHGGTVEVSDTRSGAQFVIRLPLATS